MDTIADYKADVSSVYVAGYRKRDEVRSAAKCTRLGWAAAGKAVFGAASHAPDTISGTFSVSRPFNTSFWAHMLCLWMGSGIQVGI